jgi:hypothetical protein
VRVRMMPLSALREMRYPYSKEKYSIGRVTFRY